MRKIYTIISVLITVLISVSSCNNDIEALQIVKPYEKSSEYYANLRAYKERDDHEVFFGWFGGWSANSADMIRYLESVPDSVDIISIWSKSPGFDKNLKDDLRRLQELKGTRVTFTVFAHKIPEQFMISESEVDQKGIEDYAKSLVDTMNYYGYQGIDLDYEPGFLEHAGVPFNGPLVGPSYMWPEYMDNMEIFVKALGKYIGPKSGTRNLLLIDGVPYHLNDGLAEYFNYGIVQSYRSSSYSNLQSRFDNAARKGWKPEQYIFTETFEGERYKEGGVPHTLRSGEVVPSLEGMARFKPIYNGELAPRKGGCGTYHMETDYYSKPEQYKYTRNAIMWMNKKELLNTEKYEK